MSRLIGWGLPLATAAVYAVLTLHFGARLIELAGGQLPFDLRAAGYSLTAARAYLRALPPQGFALAQGAVFWTDMLFAALMGLTLSWWMRPLSGAFGLVCLLSVTTYVALDWGENVFVWRMLDAGPDWVRPADVVRASVLTQAKFVAFALAAVLALRQSWRRHRGAA